MSHRFVLLLVLMFPLLCHSQIDEKKLDSLRRSIDSSAAARKVWQDSFTSAQDSIYENAVRKTVGTDKVAKEQRERHAQRQRIMQGILIALAIVIAVVLVLLRRKKKST